MGTSNWRKCPDGLGWVHVSGALIRREVDGKWTGWRVNGQGRTFRDGQDAADYAQGREFP